MAETKVGTWNVNSIRTRLDQVLEWLESHRPDVLCLQETKTPDDRFPLAAFQAAGWEAAYAGQKTYNGVAILSREAPREVETGFPGDPDPAQRRAIAATVAGMRVFSVYVPNGREVGSEHFRYKLEWLAALRTFLDRRHDPAAPVLLAGDFNIAPDDRDVYDPERYRDHVHCSEPERRALEALTGWGLTDLLRRHTDQPGHYSWWDYRAGRFRRDQGLRIDLLLASQPLAARSVSCAIDRGPRGLPQPSDHAPVLATFR